ncbi:MAG: PQQ-binding-like beta-propeller repeat protein [Lentisphaeria bacterium]|nr:PQQ-binding-like beta-propeller repeat protein [Lentisphaeria bacterium]
MAMIERPRRIVPKTVLANVANIAVVAPSSTHGKCAAGRIHEALRAAGLSAVLRDNPSPECMVEARGPLFVVGNLADSECMRDFYYRFLCATDLWYPGPGGYELRTLCDPFGTGHNVILVGYSDEAGADRAATELISVVGDELPHLKTVECTRLPLADAEANQFREDKLPETDWQIANSQLGDRKGYLYYLTGEPSLGEAYRQSWRAIVACGYEKTEKIVQTHLFSLSRIIPLLLIEHMDLFSEDERLAITQFLYGWAESEEGYRHVERCPRVRSPHTPRQNHELFPALALAYTADHFRTHYPELPGPDRWEAATKMAFAPYGSSWKPLCDGLCHGWWLSQPAMLDYALRDPQHRYFEEGGARTAAECAMAVVNNQGWLVSAGDSDLRRQFPGPSLRMAGSYYGDGRCHFVHNLADANRRLICLGVPARAFADGVQPEEPTDMIGTTVVPVDPLVYNIWDKDPAQAVGAVETAPDAPIEQCFDKLAVRSGWGIDDDYLLLDGLGGGSHAYADAAGILDYSRLGLSLIVSEDSFVCSAPEAHSIVTVNRDGECGVIPGFAILEANTADDSGNTYLRMKLKGCAGADWVRELFLEVGSCLVIRDTVIARQPGDFAVESHLRTPAEIELSGREAVCRRQSPTAGNCELRMTCLEQEATCHMLRDPVHLRYKSAENQSLWRRRYHTDDVVLMDFVSRRAVRLEAGESVSLTHLVQLCTATDQQLHLREKGGALEIVEGDEVRRLEVCRRGSPPPATAAPARAPSQRTAREFLACESRVTALCPVAGGGVAVGSEDGTVLLLDPDGTQRWSMTMSGSVHDIGTAPVDSPMLVVGHGPDLLTALDLHGNIVWHTRIEREPCPWPWWELPTPMAVQVAGGMDADKPFFAVGCGDIKMRGYDGAGNEIWRQRYNEGVPGRVRVFDVDGSGKHRAVVGGDILSDTAACRIWDPDGRLCASLDVETWTSNMTALSFGSANDRPLMACGANRGNNLHLFDMSRIDLDGAGEKKTAPGSDPRLWMKQLGGRVNGIHILSASTGVVAGTSQGFVLCYDLDGQPLWHALRPRAVDHVAPFGSETLVLDSDGRMDVFAASGAMSPLGQLPARCTKVVQACGGLVLACDRSIQFIGNHK